MTTNELTLLGITLSLLWGLGLLSLPAQTAFVIGSLQVGLLKFW